MVDFSRQPESKNFEDRTGAPWYDPNKLLGNIIVAMSRVVDVGGKQRKLDNTQRQRDANPLPPLNWDQNMKARVSAPDSKGGRTITRPGQIIDEYIPGEPSGLGPDEQQAILDMVRKTKRR